MAFACEICGKKTVKGRSQRHGRGVAGRRWKKRAQMTLRRFRPNIQRATFVIQGKEKQMKVCTKCIKRVKKYGSVKEYKNISVV